MNSHPHTDVILGLHEGEPFLLDADTRRRHLHVIARQGPRRQPVAQHCRTAQEHHQSAAHHDEGRILIVNLAKGPLGEGTSHLLGALVSTAWATAAQSRADTPASERRPFYLYADEFQNYASAGFAGEPAPGSLGQCRIVRGLSRRCNKIALLAFNPLPDC
jgi:hypothetical protein